VYSRDTGQKFLVFGKPGIIMKVTNCIAALMQVGPLVAEGLIFFYIKQWQAPVEAHGQ